MRKQPAPHGWAFSSADFSLQAAGKNPYGNVTFIRDEEERASWHKLPEEVKEQEDGPPLYIYGRGETLVAAIADAKAQMEEVPFLTDG